MNFNNTNWNLYKSFVVAFETKSLYKASEILGVSRSAISQNIKELGNQLGIVLFTPTAKGIVPTRSAFGLYESIKNVSSIITVAENSLHDFNADQSGVIKMVIPHTVVEYCIVDYIKDFCAKYPKIRLEIYRRDSMSLFDEHEIDFIIDIDYIFKNKDLKTAELFTVNGAFVATKELMAKYKLSQSVTRADLQNIPIITYREWAWQYKNDNQIFNYADSTSMIYLMAKKSVGIGYFCKELLNKIGDTDLVEIRVKDFAPLVDKVICGYDKNLSLPAKTFLEGLLHFRKIAKSN